MYIDTSYKKVYNVPIGQNIQKLIKENKTNQKDKGSKGKTNVEVSKTQKAKTKTQKQSQKAKKKNVKR